MLNCHPEKIKDLSQGLGLYRHYYCIECKAHYYKGTKYTKKEWEKEFQ